MSNFAFFHNVFNAICILKSFDSHVSVVVCSYFEFGTVSKWCIGEWVKRSITSQFFFQNRLNQVEGCYWIESNLTGSEKFRLRSACAFAQADLNRNFSLIHEVPYLQCMSRVFRYDMQLESLKPGNLVGSAQGLKPVDAGLNPPLRQFLSQKLFVVNAGNRIHCLDDNYVKKVASGF